MQPLYSSFSCQIKKPFLFVNPEKDNSKKAGNQSEKTAPNKAVKMGENISEIELSDPKFD